MRDDTPGPKPLRARVWDSMREAQYRLHLAVGTARFIYYSLLGREVSPYYPPPDKQGTLVTNGPEGEVIGRVVAISRRGFLLRMPDGRFAHRDLDKEYLTAVDWDFYCVEKVRNGAHSTHASRPVP